MKRKEGRAKESLMVLRDMVGEKVRSKPLLSLQKCRLHPHTLYWHYAVLSGPGQPLNRFAV